MILSFNKKLLDKYNLADKLASVLYYCLNYGQMDVSGSLPSTREKGIYNFNFLNFEPVIRYLIVKSESNYWRIGCLIQCCYFGKKDSWRKVPIQFIPAIRCKNIQNIQIKYVNNNNNNILYINIVDNNKIILSLSDLFNYDECLEFIKKAGFDTVEEFREYFPKDFNGKILHLF